MSQDAAPTEGYNTPIPAKIMTPDRVETRIGTLEFADGIPSEETTALLWDHLDFLRGVEAFLNCIPPASLEALSEGHQEVGVDACHQAMMFNELMDSNPLFLTGNTDTVYVSLFMDLERDGPTVVEIPPGCGPGTVNDAWFRFVIDMGAPGPDRGAGGTYLILPPGFEGEVPDGYFVAESPSYVNWLILRGLLVDGKPDAAAAMFRNGLRVYPLSAAGSPPQMEFTSLSRRVMNTIHANNFEFYEELARVIAREPIDVIDAETRGLLAAIGIEKDQPFAPDERMRAILEDAVAVGNATARAIDFRNRDPEALVYDDRRWTTAFVGGDYRWLRDDGRGGRHLDARTLFFYLATVNTPAMALEMVGAGSQYAAAMADADGQPLDGAGTYRLRLPANVPAKDFWSIVAYDPRPAPSSRPASRSRVATTKSTTCTTTTTDPSTSSSDRNHRPRSRTTGSRPCPARGGSSSSGSTARSSPGSTRPGDRATSSDADRPDRSAALTSTWPLGASTNRPQGCPMTSAPITVCPSCGTKNRVPATASGVPRCGKCQQDLPWVVDAGAADFDEIVSSSTLPVVVDLWAPWCGPCRVVSPLLEQLAADLAGRLKLVKVNVDQAPAVQARFAVQGIPTFVLLEGGTEQGRLVGAHPLHELRAWVERTAGISS